MVHVHGPPLFGPEIFHLYHVMKSHGFRPVLLACGNMDLADLGLVYHYCQVFFLFFFFLAFFCGDAAKRIVRE